MEREAMLMSMFPEVEPALIVDLLQSFKHNVHDVIDFLTQTARGAEEEQRRAVVTPAKEQGPFGKLPLVILENIASFMDLFGLALLSTVNRELYVITSQIFAQTTSLRLAQYRDWPDWKLLRMIGKYSNLTLLDMSRCTSFRGFKYLPTQIRSQHFHTLSFSGCSDVDDNDIIAVSKSLPRLKSLDLSKTGVSDFALEFMSNIGLQLERLVLARCQYVSDTGIRNVLHSMPSLGFLDLKRTKASSSLFINAKNNLYFLNLSMCQNIGQLSLDIQSLKTLQTLNLCSMQQLCRLHIKAPQLESLNVSNSKMLLELHVTSPLLVTLNLSGCKSLSAWEGTFPLLNSVNLYNCHALLASHLLNAVDQFHDAIRQLSLRGMFQLTDRDVLRLLSRCTHLESLDVAGCKNLSDSVRTRAGK